MNDSIRGDKCQKREHVCSEKKAQAEEQETQWDGDRHPPAEESSGGVLGKTVLPVEEKQSDTTQLFSGNNSQEILATGLGSGCC